MKELLRLADSLRKLDEIPEVTMRFWALPSTHHNIIEDLLQDEIRRTGRERNLEYDRMTNLYDQANSHLMANFWAFAWPNHDYHFHKSFAEYANCPYTCLTELADCVENIAKQIS